jgi:hypothetical protein
MIAFNKDYDPDREIPLSQAQLKKLIKSIIGASPYTVGAHHGGLSPTQITQIISFLMYKEGHESIQIIIDKEIDGYHLALTIDKTD